MQYKVDQISSDFLRSEIKAMRLWPERTPSSPDCAVDLWKLEKERHVRDSNYWITPGGIQSMPHRITSSLGLRGRDVRRGLFRGDTEGTGYSSILKLQHWTRLSFIQAANQKQTGVVYTTRLCQVDTNIQNFFFFFFPICHHSKQPVKHE